jgi:sugar phosphate isomerase/epimerase
MGTLSLGIVSDEISTDFRQAVQLATSWGISRFELRCLNTGRVPFVQQAELDDALRYVKEQQIAVTALSPGVFKHPLSKKDELERECVEVLPMTIAMAKQFGASLIIIFGFQREPGDSKGQYAGAVELMRRAARLAENEGVKLAIENEPGFWCDTGANTSRFIRDVASPALGANWDPCNAYGTNETPFPDGYLAVRSFIVNVHVKDTKRGALVQCVPVGEGALDWSGQIAALLRDRIVRHVTIETHCLPLIENSRRNVETLQRLLSELTHTGERVP